MVQRSKKSNQKSCLIKLQTQRSSQKQTCEAKKKIFGNTLDYGISMPAGINMPGGTFGKIDKRASWKINL